MIKATGCSLCQKEEEINSQITDYSVSEISILMNWRQVIFNLAIK
jgi:hypothetical protein